MRCEPCGFDRPDLTGVDAARAHRAQHLAAFPTLDEHSRRVLDELVTVAASVPTSIVRMATVSNGETW